MRRAAGVLAMAVFLIAATPTPIPFGGWAVTTLQDVPEYLEVGTPTTLSFKIRQHGRTLLDDRAPSLMLKTSDSFLSRFVGGERVFTTKGDEPGLYHATITPSEAGDLHVTVETDVYGWKVKLLPFHVVAAGEAPRPMPRHERGTQLFAAKGCATCHNKHDAPEFADWQVVSIGPDLTGRTFPADWLAQKIADPAQFRPRYTNALVMPALAVDEGEIAALVSFLNGERVVTETEGETGVRMP